jgi:trehalose 6-phosphate phosphatase
VPNTLDDRIREIAQAPILLVATDFDGTVAPIVLRPDQVDPNREALVALRRLSETPDTHVAVISGRALADLSSRLGPISAARLVGSHGSEFEAGFVDSLSDAQREKLEAVADTLSEIALRYPGSMVERKPASVAFHYRAVDRSQHAEVVEVVASSGLGALELDVKRGKMVIEFGVIPLDKGVALEKLRQRLGASAVVYFGDDVTDEDAFAKLRGPDLSVKVGDGETCAAYRVADSEEVARVLARIAKLRSAWHCGSADVPIEAHALLSDQRTIALVAPNGRIPWFCAPRIDSAAIFAELLGGASAGYFEVRASGSRVSTRQAYVGDSLVLETHWPGFKVTDYLDAAAGMAFQRAGRTSLFRIIEGTGPVTVTFAPRFDFGRGETRLERIEGGIVIQGTVDSVVLHAPGVEFEIFEEGHQPIARATFELGADPVVLELRYGTANIDAPRIPERRRREQNIQFWQSWASSLRVPQAYSEQVRRSALVLKALTYGPTGAIAAAGTTSLPESLGGTRNWDYRFCWPRDAAVSAHSLARIGATGIGQKFLDWLLDILESAGHGAMLAPVYTVAGAHLPPEAELTHLHGYGGSRPVRVSNAAAQQIQLDVFGPIGALIAELARQGCPLSGEHRRLVESMVATIEQRWREPDHGIWEIRLPRRHHVHSKVMCWQAVDQSMEVSRYLGRVRDDWRVLRDTIRDEIVREGTAWGAMHYGTSFGHADVDAAALWVGLTGMLPPDDPRYRATIEVVERELTCPDGVYRYRFDDGLPGREGVFNLCTTWLVESLMATGRRPAAEALFQRYLQQCGPTGSLAEEFDPVGRRALGNVPQAYSHAGLISAAVRLTET